MIERAIRVFKQEGLTGVAERLYQRLYLLKLEIVKSFNRPTINSRYGVLLASNFDDATFKFYVCGSYGRYYWNRLSGKTADFIFIDIGANQGLYSICAAQNANNVASYAFEPVPKTFDLLTQNIELNQVQDKCVLIKKAISDTTAVAEIEISNQHSGAASLSRDGRALSKTRETLSIETIDGAALKDVIVLRENTPIVVKIDVEGFEKTVIEQLCKSCFIDNITEIYYEVNEDWVSPNALQSVLQSVGFESFEQMGSGVQYDVLATRPLDYKGAQDD